MRMGLTSHIAHAHIHTRPGSHMHTEPLDLPAPGLDIPVGSKALSALPLCLPTLLALSVLSFHLQPSRTSWQGDLGHLAGDGEREGTEQRVKTVQRQTK